MPAHALDKTYTHQRTERRGAARAEQRQGDADNGEEAEGLLQIVTEINHTQVEEEEILIDAVYKYTSGDEFIHREA